jgi:hypothetical protein
MGEEHDEPAPFTETEGRRLTMRRGAVELVADFDAARVELRR